MITGILEVDVKPRLQMWSWQHIRRHRQMVKRYRELYKTKITSKKPSEELLRALEVRGQVLHLSTSVFNTSVYVGVGRPAGGSSTRPIRFHTTLKGELVQLHDAK